jgi:hypothetical protein
LDGTNSKIIMLDENHAYVDESYTKDEIFGWMWNMNEFCNDNWKYINFLDETFDWLIIWMKVIPKQLFNDTITWFTFKILAQFNNLWTSFQLQDG